jgi:hypothetical protein
VTVRAGRTITVDVTLRVDASLAPGGVGDLLSAVATASGNVVLKPTAGTQQTLRVPFSATVRGTSEVEVSPDVVRLADQVTVASEAEVGAASSIEFLAWGLADEEGDTTGTDLLNVGFETQGDIGAFLFHTADALSNPSVNEWDVLLNTDDDPAADYALVGRDRDSILTGEFTGRGLVTLVVDVDTQTIVNLFPAASTFNSGFVGLLFSLSDVGLAPGVNEEFEYTAGIISLERLGDDVLAESAFYNPYTQPVDTAVFATVEPGGPIVQTTLSVNREQLAKTPVKGWLVFTPLNEAGEAQIQTVRFRK